MNTQWFVAVLGLVAWSAAASGAGMPKLEFDRTTYDFGKTGQVETVTGTFKFKNTGDAELKIKPPQPSCGCTIASLKPDTLAPGESGELAFSLSLGKSRANLEKHITITSNDPKTPEVSLVIKADYTPLYEVTPMILSPTLPRTGKGTNFVVQLARTDGKPLRVRKVEPSKPWITAKLLPPEKDDPSAARIGVEVQSDGQPRRFSEYVHVYSVDETNAPVTMVYVYGQVLGDITLTPEAIYWNIIDPAKLKTDRPDAQVTRQVTIRSVDGKPFELRNGKSTLADMKLELTPKNAGATYELVATLADAPAKSVAGTITFESTVATQPRVEVPFVVHVAPKL